MIQIELLLIRQIAILIASAIGAYTDYKTGYIYDWVTAPLIVFGLAINIYEGQFPAIGLGIAVFAIGYALYYTGKLGGGDVKLYTGIALTLPFYSGIFILSAALLAALSAVLFFSVYYTLKYLRKGIDFKYNENGIRRAGILCAIIILYLYFLYTSKIIAPQYALAITLPMLFGTIFMALEKGIRKEFFLKKIKTGELEEDEIIALDFMNADERKKTESGIKGVMGKKEKETLIKKGITEIYVYRNLPRFGPFIFLGVLIAIITPNNIFIFG